MDGGAEARLQALRKRHPKPSMVKLLKRVRSRMSQCSMWDKADMCKACALAAAVLAACVRLLVCPVAVVSYGLVASSELKAIQVLSAPLFAACNEATSRCGAAEVGARKQRMACSRRQRAAGG